MIKLIKVIKKIELRAYSLSRVLMIGSSNMVDKHWRWLKSCPVLKESNNNFLNFLFVPFWFLNLLVFFLAVPIIGLGVLLLPIVITVYTLCYFGLANYLALIFGVPIGILLTRRYILDDL